MFVSVGTGTSLCAGTNQVYCHTTLECRILLVEGSRETERAFEPGELSSGGVK
jgi:hypothetical protein